MRTNVQTKATITYHVRYLIREFNEWWDWRAKETPQEAIDSFEAHKPRVEASEKAMVIKTTTTETEEVVKEL